MPSPSHPVASVHDRARLCVNPAFPAETDAPSRTVAHTQTALLPPCPRTVRGLRTLDGGRRRAARATGRVTPGARPRGWRARPKPGRNPNPTRNLSRRLCKRDPANGGGRFELQRRPTARGRQEPVNPCGTGLPLRFGALLAGPKELEMARVRGRFRLTADLAVPARARAHARHPGADVRKRFEVDAEAGGELEPGRARAVGDREGADDVVLPLELSVENVQDLRHALPPALEYLLVPLLRRPAEHLKTHRA